MAPTDSLIPDFDDFERYYSGEMSPSAQRLLEGRILAEPLVAEAYEGFLAWRAQQAQAPGVHADLQERLRVRVARDRRKTLPLWTYASAASVMLAVFSYWFVVLRDPKVDMPDPAAAMKQEEAMPGANSSKVQQGQSAELVISAPATSEGLSKSHKKTGSLPATQPKPEPDITFAPSVLADEEAREDAGETSVPDSFPVKTEVAQAPPRPAQALVAPGGAEAVGKSMAGRARMEPESLIGKHLVAAKPASNQKDAYTVLVPADTLAAAPVGGWPAYRTYLDKNTGSASTTGQIVVTFVVSPTGVLSGFVAKGPEELRSDAIRIISNGPAWVPARSKGLPVMFRAEIHLQFRQSQ